MRPLPACLPGCLSAATSDGIAAWIKRRFFTCLYVKQGDPAPSYNSPANVISVWINLAWRRFLSVPLWVQIIVYRPHSAQLRPVAEQVFLDWFPLFVSTPLSTGYTAAQHANMLWHFACCTDLDALSRPRRSRSPRPVPGVRAQQFNMEMLRVQPSAHHFWGFSPGSLWQAAKPRSLLTESEVTGHSRSNEASDVNVISLMYPYQNRCRKSCGELKFWSISLIWNIVRKRRINTYPRLSAWIWSHILSLLVAQSHSIQLVMMDLT